MVGFIFATSQKTAGPKDDEIYPGHGAPKDSAEPEPAPASGGSGQGVRSGKKDRSGLGNVDQLEGVQQYQKDVSNPFYRPSTKKSEQNIDNKNKKSQGQSIEDIDKDQ